MNLYDLLSREYETTKFTIHLTRFITYEGLTYQRSDTIHDPDTIDYSDKKAASIQMFSCKAKGHLEVWASIEK